MSNVLFAKVPAYVAAQVLGSTLASGTLRLIFNGRQDHFAGTLPVGSDLQSLVLEFIITFYLMFVISGVATDNRAVSTVYLRTLLICSFKRETIILKDCLIPSIIY